MNCLFCSSAWLYIDYLLTSCSIDGRTRIYIVFSVYITVLLVYKLVSFAGPSAQTQLLALC